jgi:hypothetical protein
MIEKIVGLGAESYSLTALTRIFTDGSRIFADQSRGNYNFTAVAVAVPPGKIRGHPAFISPIRVKAVAVPYPFAMPLAVK